MKKILLTSIAALAIVGTAHAQLQETVGNSKFFNEADGGGIMYDNNGKKSFVGVNDGKDDIDVQLYSLDENKNGSRLNVTKDGIYYGVGTEQPNFNPENEIATKGNIANSLSEAKTYADDQIDELSESLSSDIAAATKEANDYTDTQIGSLKDSIISGSAGAAALANSYTDAQVDKLEKNVSGGIAAATALSSVEVSNVKQGEMSVGGGYGYYNGESAGAFGAALGLTDDWSVNAGAGIATGDKTQVSFRAGTNYKFKLF